MSETINTKGEESVEPVMFDAEKHVDNREIIICLKRSEKGPMLLICPRSRQEMISALGECQMALTKEILAYDMQMAKERERGASIHKPNIIDIARSRFGKSKRG